MRELWDFDDPAGSIDRFRAAQQGADARTVALLQTQVARALGLQGRFEEGHAVLDSLQPDDRQADGAQPGDQQDDGAQPDDQQDDGARAAGDRPDDPRRTDPELAARVALERGRLHRSAGDEGIARRLFEGAARISHDAGLDELEVDALHMVALVVEPAQQVEANRRALTLAQTSADPAARGWRASLLNNLGMAYADRGDWQTAHTVFEEALAARRDAAGDKASTNKDGHDHAGARVTDNGAPTEPVEERAPTDPDEDSATIAARWMVAWALRHLGRRDEALAEQLALRDVLAATGRDDRYVAEEIALLTGRDDAER